MQVESYRSDWHFGSNRSAGADPRFPVGGGTDPLGAPTYGFVNFSQKLHEIEKILGRRGERAGDAPLDPPLISAKIYTIYFNALLPTEALTMITLHSTSALHSEYSFTRHDGGFKVEDNHVNQVLVNLIING